MVFFRPAKRGLPAELFLLGIGIDPGTAWGVPIIGFGLTNYAPTGRSEAGATFTGKCVGY